MVMIDPESGDPLRSWIVRKGCSRDFCITPAKIEWKIEGVDQARAL